MEFIIENGKFNYSFEGNISGIYVWNNNINNKKYIGKSIKVKERVKGEMNNFLNNKNGNLIALYNAVNKYGIENFNVYFLESINNEKKLKDKEIYYIDYFDSKNDGYNCTFGGDGTIGHIVTKEQINKKIN